jgi:hypothetical protein
MGTKVGLFVKDIDLGCSSTGEKCFLNNCGTLNRVGIILSNFYVQGVIGIIN